MHYFGTIIIASDHGDLTLPIILQLVSHPQPGSEIMLRKSDSFRSCNLACCCSGVEFLCALHNDTLN